MVDVDNLRDRARKIQCDTNNSRVALDQTILNINRTEWHDNIEKDITDQVEIIEPKMLEASRG